LHRPLETTRLIGTYRFLLAIYTTREEAYLI
jgi:hypothetical protein